MCEKQSVKQPKFAVQYPIEEIVSQITSISYIPRYSDGKERVEYTRDALGIIPGDVTLRFDVHPADAASEIAANWESVLSARAVYTLTKAGAGDFVDLKVKGATVENGVLSVTVSAEEMNKDFILGNISASVNLRVTASGKNIVSDYVTFTPVCSELTFVRYLLQNFDTDNDGIIELEAVANAKEVNISGMNITTLEGVVDKMTSLEKLDCSENSISHLDISKNTKLIDLDCEKNALDYLDFTKNTELEILNCAGNNIESLDLCNCVRLKKLNVANNKLGKLNLYSNPDLEELLCNDNDLKSLDMSANNCLSFVDFSGNENLSDIRQAGVDIDGVTWATFNIGEPASRGDENKMGYADAQKACPSGWRLPKKEEFSALLKNSVVEWLDILGNGYGSVVCCFSSNGMRHIFLSWSTLYWTSSGYISITPERGDAVSFELVDNITNSYLSARCVKD